MKQSPLVLALLFAGANAVKLDSQAAPVYDQENGLWRDSLVQTETSKKTKADPLSPENMDPWVYKYTKENIDPYTQWHMEDNIDQTMKEKWNGMAQKKKPHHHKKKDIGERGYDEEVQQFVKEYIPPLNTMVRSPLPFVPNGSDPSAHEQTPYENTFAEGKHKHKKNKKFIGERGYDTDVQQFVWDTIHNPLTSSERDWYAASVPFIPNGSKNQYSQHKKHHKHGKKARDFAERGMDEEVHGFVNEAILEPINVRNRVNEPWVPNGSAMGDWGDNTFAQNKKHHRHGKKARDFAERGMDEEVHGFVNEAILEPINVRNRVNEPWVPNGSAMGDWGDNTFAQNKHHHKKGKKFIGERGYDTDVQQFVWDTIHNPLTSSERDWYAASVPFIPNGSKNQYAQQQEQEDASDSESESDDE